MWHNDELPSLEQKFLKQKWQTQHTHMKQINLSQTILEVKWFVIIGDLCKKMAYA